VATNGPVVHLTGHIYEYGESWWNDTDREKPNNAERNLFSVTVSTTNPTWTDPGVNLGLHVEGWATDCLSHGMAHLMGLACISDARAGKLPSISLHCVYRIFFVK
jgi:hypothetical protein